MSFSHATAEDLVIGGGPAGSMLALRLAGAGCEVTLLEKEREPHHKVCGEFLSREAVEYLQQVGISPCDLGATGIGSVRLSSANTLVNATLPFRALSLSRYALDEAMLAHAEARGCSVRRGALVEKLTARGDHWEVQLREGESICAKTVFVASGKHDLRGWSRPKGRQSDLIGFKMHWQLAHTQTEALRELMELFLFQDGYGGLSLVEGDVANLCLVVRRSRLHKIGGWTELLAAILKENPHMRHCMQNATTLWARPLAISPIPYGYLAKRPGGIWRVGDQAAVIPSFTGDGMSIALHSATLAVQMYLAGETADAFSQQLHRQLHRGMALATLLSRMMVTGGGRRLAPVALSLFPDAMRWIASSTRIPDNALIDASTHAGVHAELRATHGD